MNICSVKKCNNPHHGRGYCSKHYQRLRKYGNPRATKVIQRGGFRGHELYFVYFNMLGRCNNPNYWKYSRYGGRGVKVCKRWGGVGGFANFTQDMGKRPTKEHQLDRIDNDGDYSPTNCRWATKYEQMANTSNTIDTVGVGWHKQRGKWRARIKVQGKDKSLGLYENKADAIEARKQYELRNNIGV